MGQVLGQLDGSLHCARPGDWKHAPCGGFDSIRSFAEQDQCPALFRERTHKRLVVSELISSTSDEHGPVLGEPPERRDGGPYVGALRVVIIANAADLTDQNRSVGEPLEAPQNDLNSLPRYGEVSRDGNCGTRVLHIVGTRNPQVASRKGVSVRAVKDPRIVESNIRGPGTLGSCTEREYPGPSAARLPRNSVVPVGHDREVLRRHVDERVAFRGGVRVEVCVSVQVVVGDVEERMRTCV
jgi:hypothetical protein